MTQIDSKAAREFYSENIFRELADECAKIRKELSDPRYDLTIVLFLSALAADYAKKWGCDLAYVEKYLKKIYVTPEECHNPDYRRSVIASKIQLIEHRIVNRIQSARESIYCGIPVLEAQDVIVLCIAECFANEAMRIGIDKRNAIKIHKNSIEFINATRSI